MKSISRLALIALPFLSANLAFAAGSAEAQQQPPQPQPRTLSISASATVDRAPDQAVIILAVESEGQTAKAAAAANSEKMDRVMAALKAVPVPANAIRTTSYELQPQYSQETNRSAPHISGYRAMNTVQVTLDVIDRVGPVIDASLGAGANRITDLSFGIKDAAGARAEALKLAVQRARSEAEAIAAALGERLGPALSVNADQYMPQPRPQAMYRMSADMAAAPAAPTPVSTGTLQIGANISITFRLDGAQ